jgi:hypothetical protein
MPHVSTKSWRLLACGIGLFAATTLVAQPPAKARFKVVTFAELTKGTDDKKGESAPTFLDGLNRLGKSGWEAMAESERGIVFREAHNKMWEYRVVRAPESTWNGKSDDDEVLQLVLDGLSSQGWELCLGRAVDTKHIVFKRSQARYDDKDSKKVSVVPVPIPFRNRDLKPPIVINDGKK